jgi:pimeloyl-ACP methyl ester carboxylesterase
MTDIFARDCAGPTLRLALLTLILSLGAAARGAAQEERVFRPEVTVQKADYAAVRRRFRTTLRKRGPSPQGGPRYRPPKYVTEVDYGSAVQPLHAWMSGGDERGMRRPAVLFLHGGFGFGPDDWDMVVPYWEAGFVVMVPMLRGENGQGGEFSFLYDEVDDVLAAAAFLARQPTVDPTRIFLAGHSAGATLALLAAEASPRFRAVTSFDASPDLQLLYHGSAKKSGTHAELVFDPDDLRELEVRSPLAYARSLKSPLRAYYSTEAVSIIRYPTERLIEVARGRGVDAVVSQVEGSHMSHVARAMPGSIAFFKTFVDSRTATRMTPRAAPAWEPSLEGNTTFRLRGNPSAKRVTVAGSFNGWDSRHLICGRDGTEWICRVDLQPGRYTYQFIVDDAWMLDPANPARADDGNGGMSSLLVKDR